MEGGLFFTLFFVFFFISPIYFPHTKLNNTIKK